MFGRKFDSAESRILAFSNQTFTDMLVVEIQSFVLKHSKIKEALISRKNYWL